MSPDIRQGHATDLLTGWMGEPPSLIATDPPYALGGEGAEHAISATVAVALREAARLLLPGGWMVVFAASSWRSVYYMVEATRGLLTPKRVATWAKPAASTKARTAGWAWASVLVLALQRPGDKVPDRPPTNTPDHILCPPERHGRRAQLPYEVAAWAVAPYAVPGAVMLDPFAGSGMLCQAAEAAGMTAVGLELAPAPSDGTAR